MSLEAWSTVASLGTFLVVAATALAALVQLRHLRSSNQIAAITGMIDTLDSLIGLSPVTFLTASCSERGN
jgi:hypothetical protein